MQRIFLVAISVLLTGCASQTERSLQPGVEIRGTVVWMELEGGFWALRGEDNRIYEPINLPATYQIDGLPVIVKGLIRRDHVSIRMAGPIIEIQSINKR